MPKHPFEMVPLPAGRSTKKPRSSGLTMMMDWGETLEFLEAHLTLCAPYVDLGKIVVGHSRLYTEDYYRAKLDLYLKHNVRPFIGGQFLEYVFATQGWDAVVPYCEEAKRFGVKAIEVSDNCVPLDDQERAKLIRICADTGLEIHGEVGAKTEDKHDPAELITQANICFESGCEIVLVEAAEIMENGEVNRDLVEAIRNDLDISKVLFELPGHWIKGTTSNDIFEMQLFLIDEFGPDVNIANVQPQSVFNLEALRCGLSVAGPKSRDW
jgi:phosphosulfolactate synthase